MLLPENKRLNEMETFTLVRPEHLNHHGQLFGGRLLEWVDEYAWLAAARDYPSNELVTRAMDSIDFKYGIPNGSILRFSIGKEKEGTTSVTYKVEVFTKIREKKEQLVFSNKVTFVAINQEGTKVPLVKDGK